MPFHRNCILCHFTWVTAQNLRYFSHVQKQSNKQQKVKQIMRCSIRTSGHQWENRSGHHRGKDICDSSSSDSHSKPKAIAMSHLILIWMTRTYLSHLSLFSLVEWQREHLAMTMRCPYILIFCSGSNKCTNRLCSFRKQGGPNLTHFDKANACKFCGCSADFVPCSASKVWEFNDCRQSVKVYHHGYHTCPVIAKPDVKEASDALKKKFFANSEMKPHKAVASIIIEAIKENRAWEDIDWLTEVWSIQIFKKDPLYIFDMNDSRFNSDRPTFVFSTSQEKMLLASKIQRNSKFLLEKEYCHFDGKYGKVRGMKTLTASVFHPLLGKMVRLGVMHCEYEDATNVALFWQLFNKALPAASENSLTTFQPYGYMMDESGAEWAGLQRECGEQEVEVAKSCQFHYK